MITAPTKIPILRYKKSSEYTYNLPKVKYEKTDRDIYNVYKKTTKNPITFVVFMRIINECFKAAVSKCFDRVYVKVPYIGDIYFNFFKLREGRVIVDRTKLYHERIVKYLNNITHYPKLKLCTKNKRYRNSNIYTFYATKSMKSFIFKKYIS